MFLCINRAREDMSLFKTPFGDIFSMINLLALFTPTSTLLFDFAKFGLLKPQTANVQFMKAFFCSSDPETKFDIADNRVFPQFSGEQIFDVLLT